jgi:arabinose-5-phosphate isomerase
LILDKTKNQEAKLADMLLHTCTKNDILNTAKEVLEIEAASIYKLIERLDSNFSDAVDILYNCKGRVVVTGMGKSGIIGKKIAATLSSTGTPSYFLHPAESTHGDSGILTRDDVVIAISNSGGTGEMLQLLPIIKRFGLKTIAMTGNKNSLLSQKSDVTIDISVEKEACPLNKAPTASTTVTLAMGDALAVCLLKKRGFTAEDFLLFHPSGSLGKGFLYTAGDLMTETDKLPIVRDNDKFQAAIKIISEKGLGIAVVADENNKTTGVLTDGDIRRAVLNYSQFDNLKVSDVMSKNPKTIKKAELAAKALQIMEQYAITSLVINDDNGIPEGIIHIHSLLKAGVA